MVNEANVSEYHNNDNNLGKNLIVKQTVKRETRSYTIEIFRFIWLFIHFIGCLQMAEA